MIHAIRKIREAQKIIAKYKVLNSIAKSIKLAIRLIRTIKMHAKVKR